MHYGVFLGYRLAPDGAWSGDGNIVFPLKARCDLIKTTTDGLNPQQAQSVSPSAGTRGPEAVSYTHLTLPTKRIV